MKHPYFSTVIILFMFLFAGCKKENSPGPIEKTKVSGLVEKGPFISGSKVTIYELDDELNGTGKVFESTTNDEGYFEITALKLATRYVKLSVNGYFFNEVTGKLSDAPITLEAITDIEKNDRININVLTHLEMERVKRLILEDGKDFAAAKEQAEKELLACFNIDTSIVPEKAGITNNDVSSDILIAVSSILLHNRSEAQFSELISLFSQDLKMNGSVSEPVKEAIKGSSYRLNYKQVSENIINRYEQLGKNVSVGNFHYFIDGNGNGQLEETDYPVDSPILVEEFFSSAEQFILFMESNLNSTRSFIENYFLFESLYVNNTKNTPAFSEIYNHQVTPHNNLVSELWRSSYRAIAYYNTVIEKATKDEYRKFAHASKVYRAYQYWVMTELWGNVPLVLQPPTLDNMGQTSRTAKEEIWAQLAADLSEVIQHLPEKQDGVVCSKYFAQAVLSRVYMSQGDYGKANALATQMIQSNRYRLESPQEKAFEPDNAESLFSLVDASNVANNQYFNDNIKKGAVIPLVRYAEILLIASEAGLHQNKYSEALQYLNRVRQRNGKEQLTAMDSEVIRNALLEEWKNDLSKEGLWFFAMKRFGISGMELNIDPYKNLLPIPMDEIQRNFGVTQNPGY